jgi:DNA repair protein RadC
MNYIWHSTTYIFIVNSSSIKSWAEDERPREKMTAKGAAALSDAELIAILIASGTREKSALDLAREILQLANNSLHELGRLNISEFSQVKGIGPARAITISAALELGRRRQISEPIERNSVSRSEDAAKLVLPILKDLNHEVFYGIYMNTAGKVVKHEIISTGGFTSTVVDVRVILKNCLLYNANKIIVAHNHPSGNNKPSAQDIALTKQLKEAATLLSITLLDHIIVAGNGYVSLMDEGYI